MKRSTLGVRRSSSQDAEIGQENPFDEIAHELSENFHQTMQAHIMVTPFERIRDVMIMRYTNLLFTYNKPVAKVHKSRSQYVV